MSGLFHSQRIFWPVALVAAAVVLLISVALGKVVGTTLLAHGIGRHEITRNLPVVTTTGVIGGQAHAAAVPGQSATIWIKPRATNVP